MDQTAEADAAEKSASPAAVEYTQDEINAGAKGYIKSRGLRFPRNFTILNNRLRKALRKDGYERKESDAALRLITPDDVVIELGGGIGYMSTLIAAKCKAAEVYSFEANPALIPYIRAVHQANGVTNAHVIHALLGTRKGTADFHVRKNILASSLEAVENMPTKSIESVEVLNAKSVFNEFKPTVLMCDIEGAEADLIPNLPLSGLRAAVVELHPQWIGESGVRAVFDAMTAAGLTYFPKASESKVVAFVRDW